MKDLEMIQFERNPKVIDVNQFELRFKAMDIPNPGPYEDGGDGILIRNLCIN